MSGVFHGYDIRSIAEDLSTPAITFMVASEFIALLDVEDLCGGYSKREVLPGQESSE